MKEILAKINKFIEKMMPFLTMTGIIIGFLIGKPAAKFAVCVSPLFAVMTFCSTMNMDISDFKKTLVNPLPILLFLIVFHVIQPALTYGVGKLFFSNDPDIIVGLVLLYAIPIAVSVSIWASIFNGNMPLTITLILVDTFLGPVATPLIVQFFCRKAVHISSMSLFISLVWMIIVPGFLGIMLNQLTHGKGPKKISPVLKPLSKICLFLVIVINAGKMRSKIDSFDIVFVYTAIVSILLCFISFCIGNLVAKLFRFSYRDRVAFVFTTGMRNISAALVLAMTYFSTRSSIPVVVGILFQQTLAAISGKLLLKAPPEAAEDSN